MLNKKIITIVLIFIILGSLTIFFYPKKRIVGGLGGFIEPGQSAYQEEYSCIGVKYDFCPPWPDYGCDNLCYGQVYDKKCFNVTYDTNVGFIKTKINCK